MKERYMNLPDDVVFIMKRLKELGHRSDVVGGCVRDFLLGRICNDFDITTDSSPDETKAAFSDFKTVDIGIKHGTVAVVMNGKTYEITTYRVDGDYCDNRHPNSVQFTKKLKDDCARRDFTVNAICYNPDYGFTDFYGGIDDMEDRIIRSVGDPEVRFREDALRILRGIRFSSVLNFKIDRETSKALHKTANLLSSVSSERIYNEFKKLLEGVNAYSVLLEYSDIVSVFIPCLKKISLPEKEKFNSSDWFSRLLSLFVLNSYATLKSFSESMRELKTDKDVRVLGENVIRAYSVLDIKSREECLILLRDYGERVAKETVKLGILLGKYDVCTMEILEETIRLKIPYRVSEIDISGKDLENMGIKGEKIGELLKFLRDCVMFSKCENKKENILCYLKEYLKIK